MVQRPAGVAGALPPGSCAQSDSPIDNDPRLDCESARRPQRRLASDGNPLRPIFVTQARIIRDWRIGILAHDGRRESHVLEPGLNMPFCLPQGSTWPQDSQTYPLSIKVHISFPLDVFIFPVAFNLTTNIQKQRLWTIQIPNY
jgi:hypothetical protein